MYVFRAAHLFSVLVYVSCRFLFLTHFRQILLLDTHNVTHWHVLENDNYQC
jgi:hypothetical protein